MEKLNSLQKANARFFDKAVWFYEFPFVKIINRMIHKKIAKSVSIEKGSKILDAGCGTGGFLEVLSKNKSLKLYGVDVSEKMIDLSRERLGKDVVLSRGTVEDLGFKVKFDYIFSMDSFHHYASQKKAVKNFYGALNKGGKIIVSDFSFGLIGNWLFKKFEPGNSRMLSRRGFRNLFEGFGFKDIRQRRIGIFSILTIGVK